jgi:low affinity Fe/Cu permease
MARKQSKPSPVNHHVARVNSNHARQTNGHPAKLQDDKSWSNSFSRAACETAHLAGKPLTFLLATALVVLWGVTGPLFGFSDTWQLVINTSTTIVTFLMVFLLQHTQNRDTLAIQLKLSELIIAVRNAQNKVAAAEDLSEEELERLHEEYRRRADETLDQLGQRRNTTLPRAS